MTPWNSTHDEGERRFRCRNALHGAARDRVMAEDAPKERIPRRPAPEFTEVGSFGEAMKQHGLIECKRQGNWNVYRLTKKPHSLLAQNLKCLQDLQGEEPVFRKDLRRLKATSLSAACGTRNKL